MEKPTPLTAILHRFSHMRTSPPHSAGGRSRRNCGKVMSSFSFSKITSTRRPTLASVYSALQQVAGEQCAGRVVEFDDDRGVGHGGGEALVAGVIHDRVGVDRAEPAHRLEFEVGRDALGAGRIGRVLEMPAALAALQFENATLGGIPERLGPFVRNRDRPGHLAPVAHVARRRPPRWLASAMMPPTQHSPSVDQERGMAAIAPRRLRICCNPGVQGAPGLACGVAILVRRRPATHTGA